jgi:hypothetical protein
MNLLDREGMHWWEREEGGQATLLIDKVVGSRKGSRWGTKEALKKERRAERTMLVHLNAEEMRAALVHADPDVRLAALEFLCASQTTSSIVLTNAELSLLRSFLTTSLKEEGQGYVKVVTDHIRKLLQRLRFSCSLVRRKLQDLMKYEDSPSASTLKEETRLKYVHALRTETDFIKWLVGFVVDTLLYPGAPFIRILLPLSILSIVMETYPSSEPTVDVTLSRKENLEVLSSSQSAISAPIHSALYSPIIVRGIMHLLWHPRETVRPMVFRMLQSFSSPLLRCSSAEDDDVDADLLHEAQSLLHLALRLSTSPRQREYEGGAYMLLLLFTKSQGLRIDLPSCGVFVVSKLETSDSTRLEITRGLIAVIETILASAPRHFGGLLDVKEEDGLPQCRCQGLLVALCKLLEMAAVRIKEKEELSDATKITMWRDILNKAILVAGRAALAQASHVVADETLTEIIL